MREFNNIAKKELTIILATYFSKNQNKNKKLLRLTAPPILFYNFEKYSSIF